METTNCAATKVTKRKYTRRNSQRTTVNPFTTIGKLLTVAHKPTLVTEMSQPTSKLTVTQSSSEPMLSQSQQLPAIDDTFSVRRKSTKIHDSTEIPFNMVEAPLPVKSSNESGAQPVVGDTNGVPKKITKRRYTRRNSCKPMANPFSLVNVPIPAAIKPEPVTEMTQSNGTLVAVKSPGKSVVQAPVENNTNCVAKKITKRRYTRRKTTDNPYSAIDGHSLTTNSANVIAQPSYALVAAKTPNECVLPQPKPPVANDTNSVPKKIAKRRYTRRNSFPMIDGPTFTTNSENVVTRPTYALVLSKSPSESVLPQPKPLINDTNFVPKKITKRRYTKRGSCRAVDNSFIVNDVTTPVVATPTSMIEIPKFNSTHEKSQSDSVLRESKAAIVSNDTNCIPKKITKRRYTKRKSCRTTEDPFTKIDTSKSVVLTSSPPIVSPLAEPLPHVEFNHPPEMERYTTGKSCRTTENPFTKIDTSNSIVLTSSPPIVSPRAEPVPPDEINHSPGIEQQQGEKDAKKWHHKKAYLFLKSLKQDYKRFKYLFNCLLREEQEKERRNIQELDELKRMYNRMQVEETEIKRKRWCRYCEFEATYLTSIGMQFYCSKECERKQNNLLNAMEDLFNYHSE